MQLVISACLVRVLQAPYNSYQTNTFREEFIYPLRSTKDWIFALTATGMLALPTVSQSAHITKLSVVTKCCQINYHKKYNSLNDQKQNFTEVNLN